MNTIRQICTKAELQEKLVRMEKKAKREQEFKRSHEIYYNRLKSLKRN